MVPDGSRLAAVRIERRVMKQIAFKAFSLALTISAAKAQALDGDVSHAKETWRVVMVDMFGPYNRTRKCWVKADVCMRPVRLDHVTRGNKGVFYIATSGDGAYGDCHACSGNIAFAVYEQTPIGLTRLAMTDIMAMGSWGSPPPDENFDHVKIGPAQYGWVVKAGYSGMGVTTEGYYLYGWTGTKLKGLGAIPAHYDDQGDCGEDGKRLTGGTPCSNYNYSITFNSSKPSHFFPIIVQASGMKEGKPYFDQHTLTYDDTNKLYTTTDDENFDFMKQQRQ